MFVASRGGRFRVRGLGRLFGGVALLSVWILGPAAGATPPLRVGIYENRPKVFTEASGVPAGIFVDIIEASADREGWTLEYVRGTWREGLTRLASGEIDLMPDVAYSSQRGELYAFHHEPVVSDWFQLFARPSAKIRSVLDLERKRVAVLEGSIQQESFCKTVQDFNISIDLIPFPSFVEAFVAVTSGSADAVISNRFNAPFLRQEYALEDTAVIFSPTRVYFAAPKGKNPALLDALDRNLQHLKKDPHSAYFDALRRWAAEEIPQELPHWVLATGGVTLFLALLALVNMVALKRLVNAKTKELRALVHQLGAAGRQWRSTFDAVQDAIWVLDVEGRILHSNTAAHRLFLTSPEDTRELHCWEVAHGRSVPIDDCPLMVSKRTLRRSIGTVDAGDRKLSVTVDPICDEEGRLTGFVHLVSDVTDKIRSEEDLEQYRQGLEDLVRQRTRDLEDANADLLRAKMAAESADKLKSAFLATMSHELRTPLNSIIGFTGILLQGLAGSLNEEQDKQMRMVQGSARHLLALINDVLDISKIEAGRMVLAREAFPLAPMVEKVVQSVAPTAQQKGLTLSCHIGDDVGELEGDQRRVEQILMNLLSNAIKFTPQGRVSVTCSRENDTVTLAVRDTGIGIGAEDLATLFRPFQQIETGRTRQFDGTGLGLHICKRLGELMGGSITAESVPQVGSVFTLRLPAKGAEVHAPDEDPHH